MAWQAPAPAVRRPAAAPDPAQAPVRAAQGDSAQLRARLDLVDAAQLRKQLDTPYRKWLNEDVVYIIASEEQQAFERLQTDDEREQFIEQFWLRRDPTPGTVANEFKEEHYRRIAYANEHFAAGIPGWKTDRGRIYIKYGPPDEIDDHSAGGAYARPAEERGGSTPSFPYMQWRYHHIEGVGNNIVIEFVDPTMSGEFRMTMDPSEKDALFGAPQRTASASSEQTLIDLDKAIRVAQINLVALQEVYADQHPSVVQAQSQLRTLKARLQTLQALAEREQAQANSELPLAGTAAPGKSYFVNGNVRLPGRFELAAPTTVLEALVAAGGFSGAADREHIRILRNGGKQTLNFNFQEVVNGQRLEQNVRLDPGDVVVVK
jgi:GWxTD domain-containing protein